MNPFTIRFWSKILTFVFAILLVVGVTGWFPRLVCVALLVTAALVWGMSVQEIDYERQRQEILRRQRQDADFTL